MTDTPDRAEPTDALLASYLAGTASADERAHVDAWAAADPLHREALDRLRAAWDVAAALPTEAGLRASRNAVLARIGESAEAPLTLVRESVHGSTARRRPRWATFVTSRRRRIIRDLIAVAAGIAMAAIGLRVVSSRGKALASAALTEYVTAVAERATVTLNDGTRVVLAPASHLSVSVRPDRGARDVYLVGEAMFTVRHDAARPFTVHTRSADTRDVGTTFGVRAYEGEVGTRVVVSEGLVALRRRDVAPTPQVDSIIVAAGEMGRIAEAGGLLPVQRVTADDYLGWASGRLVFDYTPLSEALPELGRWYGLDVRLADSALADRRVSATFTTESPTQVLAMLGASLGLRFDRDGQVVTVRRP